MAKRCDVPGCPRVGRFGWGSPPSWLCLEHLDRALDVAAKVVRYWSGIPARRGVPEDVSDAPAEKDKDPRR